ncbi:MAG: thiamine phosphate synthase [Mariprofundaceae bacterium]
MGAQTLLNPSPRLILITDSSRLAGELFFEVVEAALRGGVDALLLREKQLPSSRLLALAARLRELSRRYQASLIIHSQADIAEAVGADGIHVGAADIDSIAAIKTWLGDQPFSISASCHNADELTAAAKAGADWAMLSPVFPTHSHPGAAHLGPERFSQLADRAALPVVALGGITPVNAAAISGKPIAVIGAILDADDPEAAARSLSSLAGA